MLGVRDGWLRPHSDLMTDHARDDLPKYNRPPVTEVVMSVQFDPITALTPVHLGAWWTPQRRKTYPTCEERPPIEPMIETFGVPRGPTFQLRLGNGLPAPAMWFFSHDRTELLQIQRDRFTRNWIRSGVEAPYPSYGRLLPAFKRDLEEFTQFLAEADLGSANLTQVELTYINPVAPDGDVWSDHGELGAILTPWTNNLTEGFLPTPEDVQIAARYRMVGADGDPVGRLIVTVQPVFDQSSHPRYLVTVMARGVPEANSVKGAVAFLDRAHEWIVRGFTTITTEAMHRLWGRTQ